MPGVAPARYAYLGPEGTFAHAAVLALPAGAAADLLPAPTVAAACDAVRSGEAIGAVVPLENSVEGSVSSTLDELATGEPLHITREVLLPVTFALLARPGTTIDGVRAVASHPHAEAQCRRWLAARLPSAKVVAAPSTADAAAAVSAGTTAYDAAVASPLAARRYRLAVLADDIGDNPDAVTRFVLVSRPGPPVARTGADRTTVVLFIADDHPGALLEILTEFAVRGVNLTRIESRPTGSGLGRYCFSVDCAGHVDDARVGDALSALRRVCSDVRYCGSYPRADGSPAEPSASGSDDAYRDAAAWLARVRDGRPL